MKISGGQAVVKSLVDNKARIVYGLPGSQILDIYDSLRGEAQIRSILAMHEINAAFMADAHGRLTGEPGVCLVTGGPGATNAVTGIAQAYAEASPVVQITGHPNRAEKIQPFHGVDDLDFLLKIYKPLTKWSVQIEKIRDIQPIVHKAFSLVKSGRPGPVHIEIPMDVLARSGEISEFRRSTRVELAGNLSTVKRVAGILKSATSPLIVVGRGVLRDFCSARVIRLAKSLGSPIMTLPSSISAISYKCPLYIGYDLALQSTHWMVHPLVKSAVDKADTIITLGFDIGERVTWQRKHRPMNRLIHIHQDAPGFYPTEDTWKAKSIIDVQSNIKEFLKSLEKEIRDEHPQIRNIEKRISNIKKKIREDIAKSVNWGRKPLHPGEVGLELRRALDEDAIVTLDVGSHADWMKICYRACTPNTVLTPGRYGSMGFSLPAAIAAKINFPKKQVVAVAGDGGFLMSYMDFPTLVKLRLGVIVVVENDRRYGMIWNIQNAKYGGRTFATEIDIPNFAGYARAFGATGIKVTDSKDLKNALEEAVNVKGPVLVDVDTGHGFPSYIPTRFRRYIRKIRQLGVPSSH